jgi:hypothetical protein
MAKGYKQGRARLPHNFKAGLALLQRVEAAGDVQYDPEIMDVLLEQPAVKQKAAQMTPAAREVYKRALVVEGVYEPFATLYRLGLVGSLKILEEGK